MKPFKILIPFFALFSLSVPHIAYAVPDSVTQMGYHPVAVVNDVAITPYDIEKRIKLIRFLNDIPVTVTLSNSDKNALLKTITDEIIKAQEVTRFKADPKPERVNDYLKDLARQKNMTLDAFLKQLDSIGITRTEAEKIFSRQIAWRDLLQGRYGRDINVSTYEISQIIEASLKTGNLQFSFDSIIIPFDNQAELKDKQNEAESILSRLKTGENFDVIKSAYSTDIKQPESLIPLAQIDESLHSFLLQSDIGQISGLIRTKNGFEIIRLNNRQSNENTGLMIKKSFKTGLLSKDDKTETDLKSVLNTAFADKNICTDFDNYFTDSKDYPLQNIKNAPEHLQNYLLKLDKSQSTVISDDSESDTIKILTVCQTQDMDYYQDVPVQMRDDVKNRLIAHKLSLKEKEYLRDLRNQAVITILSGNF